MNTILIAVQHRQRLSIPIADRRIIVDIIGALGGAARARTRVGGPAADPLDNLNGIERSDTVTTSETEE